MSKVTPIQAAAASDATKVLVKAAVVRPAAAKPTAAKSAASKPAIAKPAPKPTIKKASVKKVVAKKPPAKKPAVKPATPKKQAEKSKVQKVKMERDSFTMPKDEYAQLTLLKARLNALGQPVKKSELLRAGIKLLVAMSDNTLKMTMAKIPVIKTGRPKKK